MKIRSLSIAGGILAMTLLTGCATAILSTAPVSTGTSTQHLVMEDEVIATGHPKAGEGFSKDSIVLIGAKHTYHLTKGADAIHHLIKFDPKSISINDNSPITLNIKDTKFSGYIQIKYQKDSYSEDELNVLTQMRFVKNVRYDGNGRAYYYYTTGFWVNGDIYAKLEGSDAIANKFSVGRKLRFVTTEYKRQVHAGKMLEKLFVLPFAVAFDVVTAPAQLLLFSSAAAANASK